MNGVLRVVAVLFVSCATILVCVSCSRSGDESSEAVSNNSAPEVKTNATQPTLSETNQTSQIIETNRAPRAPVSHRRPVFYGR